MLQHSQLEGLVAAAVQVEDRNTLLVLFQEAAEVAGQGLAAEEVVAAAEVDMKKQALRTTHTSQCKFSITEEAVALQILKVQVEVGAVVQEQTALADTLEEVAAQAALALADKF
jgi:hypothetical protein